jgi:hypothetical protein
MRLLVHCCAALLLQLGMLVVAFAQVGEGLAWRTFVIPEYGTRIEYPAAIFAPAGAPGKGVGKRLESSDGRSVLSIYSANNETGDTPLDYLRKNLRVKPAGLDYQRIARSFFAISMERGELIYYSRCNFSGGMRSVTHCFDLVYPQEEIRAHFPTLGIGGDDSVVSLRRRAK